MTDIDPHALDDVMARLPLGHELHLGDGVVAQVTGWRLHDGEPQVMADTGMAYPIVDLTPVA